MGSLASFGAKSHPGTKHYYGTSGNSFVAVVEFDRDACLGGDRGRRERSPGSPHFNDQAGRYASGNRRSVYFSPGEITGHIERSYIPSV